MRKSALEEVAYSCNSPFYKNNPLALIRNEWRVTLLTDMPFCRTLVSLLNLVTISNASISCSVLVFLITAIPAKTEKEDLNVRGMDDRICPVLTMHGFDSFRRIVNQE